MSEDEWLTTRDQPVRMWEFVSSGTRWTPRTLRLLVAAFWGWQAGRLHGRVRVDAFHRAEVFARWADTGRLPHRHRASRSPNVIFFNDSPEVAADLTVRAPGVAWGTGWEKALGPLTDRLRDIHGSPFRPVAPLPEWRTEAVVALATGIYADRAFDRLPVLADALEDAGCASEDVLAHCRGAGPHVRGCWVVDMVLGKT